MALQDDRELSRRELLAGAAALGVGATLAGGLASEVAAGVLATPKPKTGGRLRVGYLGTGTLERLAPFKFSGNTDLCRILATFDGLFNLQGVPGSPEFKPVPALALSAEPNASITQWRIKLRQGVTFHNGRPFTANDAIYSVHAVLDPKNQSPGLDQFKTLDRARTKRVSKSEVIFYLKAPMRDFPMNLASYAYMIPAGTTNFSKPIGTGPFEFVRWRQGQFSLHKRNPDYWKSGKPYLAELEIRSMSDRTAQVNALDAGQIDLAGDVDALSARTHMGSRLTSRRYPSYKALAFAMRSDIEPFNDPRVRQAMRLAIDREALVKTLLYGYGRVGNDLWGKGDPDYASSIPQRKYDPERARALLKQAGKESLSFTLITNPDPLYIGSATAFAQQAKAAGIDIKLEQVPTADYWSDRYWLKVPIQQTEWGVNVVHQMELTTTCASPGNETHWCDATDDETLQKAKLFSQGSKERKALLEPIQRRLWNSGGYIVWGYVDYQHLMSKRVRGLGTVRPIPAGVEFGDVWLA